MENDSVLVRRTQRAQRTTLPLSPHSSFSLSVSCVFFAAILAYCAHFCLSLRTLHAAAAIELIFNFYACLNRKFIMELHGRRQVQAGDSPLTIKKCFLCL